MRTSKKPRHMSSSAEGRPAEADDVDYRDPQEGPHEGQETDESDPIEPEVLGPADEELDPEGAAPPPVEIELDTNLPIEPEREGSLLPSPRTGSSRLDALQAYLQEVAKIPSLTREEEHSLAVKYLQDKDVQAAYQLISSNLWLVVKTAREYERAARNLLDLIQEGNIGLLEAIKNFDPYRGVRFPSYAVWWVRAYIIRYVIANWRMVKIGTTQAQRKLFFNLLKEKEKLERQGLYPGPKLLAEKLNVKESEVVEMEQRLGSSDMSVDAPLQEEGETDLLGVLPSGDMTAEDMLGKRELQAEMSKGLEEFRTTLNDKEKHIFTTRMLSEEKATLQEISDTLSISKERVRQIENRIREKLKLFFTSHYSAVVEDADLEP